MTNQTQSQTSLPKIEEILSGTAKGVWKKDGNEGEAPIPTVADLLSVSHDLLLQNALGFPNLLRHCSMLVTVADLLAQEVHPKTWGEDTNEAKEAIVDLKRQWDDLDANEDFFRGTIDFVSAVASKEVPDDIEKYLVYLHKIWTDLKEILTKTPLKMTAKSLKLPPLIHPLENAIRAWQIPKVEPSRRRDSGLIASNIRNTHPALSQRLPLEIAEFGQDRQMELMHNLPMGSVQLDLPFIEFPKDEIVPALPFFAHETKDGRPTRGGRGAPIEERLFMNVLLEWGIGEDRWGLTRLNSTYGDVLSWLYPNGTTAAKKDLIPRLREGFYRLHTQLVYWDRRDWNIIAVDVFPTMDTKRGDRISFTVRMPDGMPTHSGVRVTVEPLRIYGAQSAPKFRAWGRLPFIWDKAKIKNGRKRIYATVPEVLRNKDDYLVDAAGHVILTGKLYKSKDGGWTYRQGDQPQKAWYHPLAIRTGRQIPNPQGDKVPILFDSDMVKLFYDHNARKGEVFRKCLELARKHALQIEEDGWIVVWKDQVDPQTGERGWRILEPYPYPTETAKSR